MKKILFLLLVFISTTSFLFAQCSVSNPCISPDFAHRGQTLTATITGPGINGGIGLAPCNPADIYLTLNSPNYFIPATSFTLLDHDSILATFAIPDTAPYGYYSLTMQLYNYTIGSNCTGAPQPVGSSYPFLIGTSKVEGTVYYDINQNGIRDTLEPGILNERIRLSPDSNICLNGQDGYSFIIDSGSYSISYVQTPYWVLTTPASLNLHIGSANISGIDFGLHPANQHYQVFASLNTYPVCNTTQRSSFTVYNNGNTYSDITAIFIHSPNTTCGGFNVTPTIISGDTLWWNFPNVAPSAVYQINFNISFPSAGTPVSFNYKIENYDLSSVLQNTFSDSLNDVLNCFPISNEKTVNPPGIYFPHYTLIGGDFLYTIRFQNTSGDTAYSVHVEDVLDPGLDNTSLEVTASSHPVQTSLHGDTLEFLFENILLPNSGRNEPGSYGFVTYRIRPLSNLSIPVMIFNSANISFDEETPILSNVVFNTLVDSIPSGIEELNYEGSVSIFPNPFRDEFTVSIQQANVEPFRMRIFDLRGQLVFEQEITSVSSTIRLKNLAAGSYVYMLESVRGRSAFRGKIQKMK